MIGFSWKLMEDFTARLWFAISGKVAAGDAVWIGNSGLAAQRSRLLRFEGRWAVVQNGVEDELRVGAAMVWGTACREVRSVGCRIPASKVAAQSIVKQLRSALCR